MILPSLGMVLTAETHDLVPSGEGDLHRRAPVERVGISNRNPSSVTKKD